MTTGQTGPEAFVQGTFAVFETPDGGVVLVTRIAGGPEQRHHVPGPLVAVAKRMAAGEGMNPATVLRALGGGRGGRKALRGAPVDPPGVPGAAEDRTEGFGPRWPGLEGRPIKVAEDRTEP